MTKEFFSRQGNKLVKDAATFMLNNYIILKYGRDDELIKKHSENQSTYQDDWLKRGVSRMSLQMRRMKHDKGRKGLSGLSPNSYCIFKYEPVDYCSNMSKLLDHYRDRCLSLREQKKLEAFLDAVHRIGHPPVNEIVQEHVYLEITNPKATVDTVVNIIDPSNQRRVYHRRLMASLAILCIILSGTVGYFLDFFWSRLLAVSIVIIVLVFLGKRGAPRSASWRS